MAGNYVELWEAQSHVKPNETWRNNKHGTIYTTIGVGRHSEPDDNGNLAVKVYYKNQDGELWDRPWKLFLTKFTKVEVSNA